MIHLKRRPRGINPDDLVAMTASPRGQLMLRTMDREIIFLKRQVSKPFFTLKTLNSKYRLISLINFEIM